MNGLVKFILWVSVILGAVGVILYVALFDVWRVPRDDPQLAVSVEPTLSAGDLVVPIQRTYPLDDVRAAFAELEDGHVAGKIVLIP